jgi:hypothetical protein
MQAKGLEIFSFQPQHDEFLQISPYLACPVGESNQIKVGKK